MDTRQAALTVGRVMVACEEFRTALSRHLGLGTTESLAISYLDEAGERPQRDLADRLGLTAGATTGVVDRLEAAGLARRSTHPTDRRSSLVSLTDQGRHVVEESTRWVEQIVAPGRDAPTMDEDTLQALSGLADTIVSLTGAIRLHAGPRLIHTR